MAVKLPSGFREIGKKDEIVVKKGDEIILVYKRPSNYPKNIENLYKDIIDRDPAARDVVISIGGKQHGLSLCRAWSTENEIYVVYVATTDVWYIILGIGLLVFLLGFIIGKNWGKPITMGIMKGLTEGVSTLLILGVIALVIFLGVKYLLRRFG